VLEEELKRSVAKVAKEKKLGESNRKKIQASENRTKTMAEAGEELRRRLENKERKCAVLRSEQMLNVS
jgi:hypothetical protein